MRVNSKLRSAKMHYLEDYLEVIEFLPEEIQSRLLQIREIDERVQSQLNSLEDRTHTFFTLCRKNKQDWREVNCNKLNGEFAGVLRESTEKVNLATQISDLLDRYMKRLDHDLNRFTLELEADTAGITEILEQRSYILDRPPSPERPPIVPKKKHLHHDDLLDGDDYSPSPLSRSSPTQSRVPRYARRERMSVPTFTLSTEADTDLFDFDEQLSSPANLYTGSGGKPPITLITTDTRSQKKRQQTTVVAETIQEDFLGYVDPNEPRYCLCNQVSYGEMICCDNADCTIEWFHYGCVGVTEAPKGKWYCPQCFQTMKKKSRR